jgi:hypothetical protein
MSAKQGWAVWPGHPQCSHTSQWQAVFPQSNAEVSAGVKDVRFKLADIVDSPGDILGLRWAQVDLRALALNASMASMILVRVGGGF